MPYLGLQLKKKDLICEKNVVVMINQGIKERSWIEREEFFIDPCLLSEQ